MPSSSFEAGTAYLQILPSTRGLQARLKRELAGVRTEHQVPLVPELDQRAMARWQAQLRASLRNVPVVVLDADSSPADREIATIRDRMERLADLTIGIDISGDAARAELAGIERDLDRLARSSPEVEVRVDAARARAELAGVEQQARGLDGRRVRPHFDADTARALVQVARLAWAVNQFAEREYNFTVSANTFGAVASIALLVAQVGALGGLAGIVGGFGGALAGLGAAGAVGAAGLATVLLGSRGVGDALTALITQQDGAGAAAQQNARQQEAAGYAIASAQGRVKQAAEQAGRARIEGERSVADAVKSSSRQIEQAERQQASAQRTLRQATADLKAEQDALTDAWEAGRRSLQDLQDQVDGNALDQRQAAFDLADAKKALEEARATGDQSQIDRAQLAVDRQVESMDVLAKRTERAKVENDAAVKAGVAGSAEVVAANGRIEAATQRQADAAVAARDADAALERARVDGAESVARAREQADLRVADADRQVAEAQRALTQALSQTGDAGQAAADKVAQSMAELSPAGQEFVKFLFGAREQLKGLAGVASTELFPPLQAGLQALLNQAPAVSGIVATLARSTGGALNTVLTALASPEWIAFFGLLADASTTIMPLLAETFLLGATAARELLTLLLPLAPAGLELANQFLNLFRILAPFIVQLLAGLIPAASAFLSALAPLGPLLVAMQPLLLTLGQVLSTVLLAVLQALTPILIALTPLLQEFAIQWAQGIVDALTVATPLLVTVFTWLSDNASTVVTMVTVVGGLIGALKPLAFVLGLVVSALHGWLFFRLVGAALAFFGLQGTLVATIVTRLLSPISLLRLALPFVGRAILFVGRAILTALGPIGIIITLLGLLYSSNEDVRNAINGVLAVFGQLAGQLVSSLMPAFQRIVDAITPLIGLVAGALTPIIEVFAGVIVDLINTVLPPLVSILSGVVIPVIVKVADILATVLVWVINNVVVPALEALTWFIENVLVPVILWLNQHIIKPTFDAIAKVTEWLFYNVIQPAFDRFVWVLENVIGPIVNWLWKNVIEPQFTAIGALIKFVWEQVIWPAFQALGAGLTWLQDGFGTVVGWIGQKWNELRALTAKPINFLIETVWNNGIRKAWNLVADLLPGIEPIGELAKIPEYARGGPVERDTVLRAGEAGPEYILSAPAVRELGGLGAAERLHQSLIRKDPLKALQSGQVVDGADHNGPGARTTGFGGVRPHVAMAGHYLQRRFGIGVVGGIGARPNVSDHPLGLALDFMTRGNNGTQLANEVITNRAHYGTKYAIWQQAINNGSGWRRMEDRGGDTANHRDHVHVSFYPAIGDRRSLGAGSVGSNFSGSATGEVSTWFEDQVRALVGGPTDAVINAIPFHGPPAFLDIPKNAAVSARDGVLEFLLGKGREADQSAAVAGPAAGAGVQRWRPVVDQALGLLGLPLNLADTTLRRMQQESGGNERAINNWDSNAKRGTPSKGLMQVIDPTFRANWDRRTPNDIWNPLSNIVASMKYALGRYGSLPAAYDRKGGYDSGGLARGIGWLWKGTGLDERVLPPQETQAYPTLTRLSQQLEAGRVPAPRGLSDRQYAEALAGVRGGDQGGGDTFNLYELGHTPDQVASAVQRKRDFAARTRG